VTSLSRSWRRGARGSRAHGAIRAWHGACFLLPLSGCFYFGPIPDVAEGNVQPVIKSRAFEGDETITVGRDGQEVFVIAQDPEDDDVAFVWSYEDHGLIGSAETIRTEVGDVLLQGSSILVVWDPELDGDVLRCEVFDEYNDTIKMSWPLEML
jgi:hypothetical protein